MRKIILSVLPVLLTLFLFLSPMVYAVDADVEAILEPVNKIKDLVIAAVSIFAVIIIIFAGAKFMVSGDNIQAREGAKSMLTYAVIGLVVIWVAPLLVTFLTATPVPVA